jgi:hypothetical protein
MSFKKVMGTLSPAYGMISGEGLFGQGVGALPALAKKIRNDKEEDKERAAMEAAQAGRVPTMKKGGKVSSASKRADGCAQRGKTKGRIV